MTRRAPNRIVYIIARPLRLGDMDRLGISFMRDRGIDVVVIDVAKICFPMLEYEREHYSEFEGFSIRVVSNVSALRHEIRLMRDAELIVLLTGAANVSRESLDIYRALGKAGRPYLTLNTNAFPGFNRLIDEPGSTWKRLSDAWWRFRNGRLRPVDSILARVPLAWLGVPHCSFVVVGGRHCRLIPNRNAGSKTRIIAAHSMDYDDVLRRGIVTKERNIAVFIDELLPFSRDSKVFNDKSTEIADHYYTALRRLFERIERELGLTPVVAVRPDGDCHSLSGCFGRYEIIGGRTAELVAESRLVLGHRSTAMGYAVIFRKPALVLTLRALRQIYSQAFTVDSFAAALGRKLQYFDEPEEVDLNDALNIDAAAYDEYFANYIKDPDSPGLPLWQIIVDGVNRSGVAKI